MIIYLTVNLINNKFYIGQTITQDRNYLGSGILITKAIKKYGRDNFKRIILRQCSSQVIVNQDNTIIGGHFRIRVLKEKGVQEVGVERRRT